jgi:hypothetical protein
MASGLTVILLLPVNQAADGAPIDGTSHDSDVTVDEACQLRA